MREMDQRFNPLGGVESLIDDPRSPRHTDHSLLQLVRQRVYQVAAGYEDCNDADRLRVDPALRLVANRVRCISLKPAELRQSGLSLWGCWGWVRM